MKSGGLLGPFLIGMVVSSIVINAVRFKSLKSRLDELSGRIARLEYVMLSDRANATSAEEAAK